MIIRNEYLDILRPNYHNNKIKIIMGVRRCGKTTLVKQIIEELMKDGIEKEYIHYIDFDLLHNKKLKNTSILNKYLSNIFKDRKKHYLFMDEVQNINDWYKVIGIFNAGYDLSIFVTGSCSNLIKEDNKYITNYICVNMFPFNLRELDNYTLDEYMKWGSMPLTISNKDIYSKIMYIKDVYNSIVVNDILERYNVKDVELLNRIIGYILSTLSIPFSVNSMASYFESYDRKVSLDTMYNYLEYINSTFMINKLERYSLNDNRVIFGKYKYYLSDINFVNALDINKIDSIKYLIENMIYNELVLKGYKVYQGIIGTKLIDFVAFKDNKRVCIEVFDTIDDAKELKKCIKKLNNIGDSEKYILTLDNIDEIKDTVIIKNIELFLKNNDL